MDLDTKKKKISATDGDSFREQKGFMAQYSHLLLPVSFSKKEDNFKILQEIRKILTNYSQLTDKERLEFCKSERYFMKLYLKEVLSDIRKREEMM